MFAAIASVLLVQFTFSLGACPHFWTPFQGSCYHIFSQQEPWTEAQVFCSINKANLASVESAAENAFLQNLIKGSDYNTSAWLGATDVLHEGDFVWTGSNLPLTYTDWGPGEPNNFNNNENCLLFWSDKRSKWDDHSCTAYYRFICEMR